MLYRRGGPGVFEGLDYVRLSCGEAPGHDTNLSMTQSATKSPFRSQEGVCLTGPISRLLFENFGLLAQHLAGDGQVGIALVNGKVNEFLAVVEQVD